MTEAVPRVNFGLLGEDYYVTDFIQVANGRMKEIAQKIKTVDVNEIITWCADYTRRNIKYALDASRNTTSCRHTQVFKFHGPLYLVDTGECPYGWLLPNQTIADAVRRGICFDMTAFCTTLLRLKGVKAMATLGAVLRTKGKRLMGFHAWVEAFDKDDRKIVIETTSPKVTLILAEDIYSGKMAYSYDPICWFNESFWHEDKAKAEKYVEFAINVLKQRR